MNTRAELGEFLRSRRARLQPQDVGLRHFGGRRRVPGLRREELAQLAGMSADYYVRLEQGRCPNVSDPVLDAVARALQLDEVETRHLRNLARPPRTSAGPQLEPPRPGLQRLLDVMDRVPAYVVGPRAEILAWNELAVALFVDFSELPAEERNWARLIFQDEAMTTVFADWEGKARDTVAYLRLNLGRHPDDAALVELVEELKGTSDTFRRLWADQTVKEKTYGSKTFRHPLVGELTLDNEAFHLPDHPDQVLMTYTAPAGSTAEASLQILASLTTPTDVTLER